MNKANISYARNHLSKLIARVREGESILIIDRRRPVARLEPVSDSDTQQVHWLEDLAQRSLIRFARGPVDLQALRVLPQPIPVGRGDILEAQ